jgi:hypothetical protein
MLFPFAARVTFLDGLAALEVGRGVDFRTGVGS